MTTPRLTAIRAWSAHSPRWGDAWRPALRSTIAVAIAVAIFLAVLALDGANAISVLGTLVRAAIGTQFGRDEIVVKLIPFCLCAAATAIPARVGLINVGGEGQFYIGAWAATWAILYSGVPPALLLPAAVLAGALGGAAWAAIPALLRTRVNLNEAISTLLLNYVAVLLVNYFVFGPWKDRSSFNWPFTRSFPTEATLPILWGGRVHAGLLLVPIVLVAMWLVLRYTRIGFEMRAVGGNARAAERLGIRVPQYLFWSLVCGGAIAGLAGFAEVAGIQGRLRPGISVQYGFIGFLASWLGGHRPLGILLASLLFGAIAVGGDNLQLAANLPASAVNILMALLLFATMASRRAPQAGGVS